MQRASAVRLVVLLLGAALSGCFGGGQEGSDEGPRMGSVAGRVLDEAGLAVGGAAVRILTTDHEATTASDGAFRFDGVLSGKARLAVSATGFVTTTRTITVPQGGLATLAFTLQPVAVIEPHRATLPYTGTLACGLPTGIACLDEVDPNATTHPFEVEPRLRAMLVELVWTPPAEGLAGELAIDVMAATPTACGAKYAGAEGPSPLRLEVTSGHPISGGDQCVKVRPGGNATVLEQDYTLVVTLFYDQDVPSGFTGLS